MRQLGVFCEVVRKKMTKKRNDYIDWDTYFMGVARLSSLRSKDPNTQVGACIVNENKRIVGIGYNGLPFGLSDDKIDWEREGRFLETKYPYVVHAEANAILNANTLVRNATIYVTLFPCHECAKLIIQAGIKELVYSKEFNQLDSFEASMRMLKDAQIKIRKMANIEIKVKQI